MFEFKVKYLGLELNVLVWTERVGSIFEKILREDTGPTIPPSYIISLARTRTHSRAYYTLLSPMSYISCLNILEYAQTLSDSKVLRLNILEFVVGSAVGI